MVPIRGKPFDFFLMRVVVLATKLWDDKVTKTAFNRLSNDSLKEAVAMVPKGDVDVDELASLFEDAATLETSIVGELVNKVHEEVASQREDTPMDLGHKRKRRRMS